MITARPTALAIHQSTMGRLPPSARAIRGQLWPVYLCDANSVRTGAEDAGAAILTRTGRPFG